MVPLSASLTGSNLRRSRLRAVGLLCVGLLSAPGLVSTAPDPAYAAGTVGRPFAATSPFNVPIKTRPIIDPNSPAMVARITRDGQAYANLTEYGIPIYTASATTPRVRVTCAMEGDWGVCPLSTQPMPMPLQAQPSSGSDGVLVIVDPATDTIGEYWQAKPAGAQWAASWGAVNSLSGSGWGGGSTGAGASRLAGVVRVDEIRRGVIDHALVLQSDSVCAQTFRAPALKTDGLSTRADCIPEGARIQLDPSLDLTRITGITRAERAVARALQVHGGYVIDRGGAPLSISFERAPDATADYPGATYAAAGLRWDYDGMPRVPWHRLRVLQAWNR